MIRHLLRLVWNRKRANALIVAEIFVSFLVIFGVLTGAVTVGRGWSEPIGFDWHDVWDVRMEFDVDGSDRAQPALHAAVMRMLDEARSFPEVEAAAISNTPPYAFSTSEGTHEIDGRRVSIIYDDVTDDFARVMKVRVVSGRWFNAEDDAAQHPPVVLDTNAARALFPGKDALGQKYEMGENEFVRVVGIVVPYRKDGETSSPMNVMFRRIAPDGAYGRLGSNLVVRVRPGTPASFEETLSKRLQQVAPNLSFTVRHMDQMRTNALRTRLSPLVLGGIVGLFLISMVALGLTGVLWQNVTRRTREVGLRRALGATGPDVHRQILMEVALLATLACAAGSIVVAQLPILGVFSFVTPPAFTVGLVGALLTVYALTLTCGLYPSWLASRLEPADALRYE